jgi:hypothetical protein
MSTSKIKMQFGTLSIEVEGDPVWASEQVEKLVTRIETIRLPAGALVSPQQQPAAQPQIPGATQPVGNLATFLAAKGATTNQVKKFLATAEWLHQKGQTSLTTGAVTKALKDYRQSRLGNASECLSANIGKGYCERNGDGFYVTPEGRATLGTSQPSTQESTQDQAVDSASTGADGTSKAEQKTSDLDS